LAGDVYFEALGNEPSRLFGYGSSEGSLHDGSQAESLY
jgi:hypothetical protein